MLATLLCLLVPPLPNKPLLSPLGRSVLVRQPFVMELPLAAPARCEVRAVIRFLNAKGVKPIEIHRQLMEVYGESCMDVKNIRKWCREFTAGRTEIHDEERSGRPSISDETVAKVEQILRQDRRITLDYLCILLPEVSRSTIGRTLTEKLEYRKVCARWSHACSQKTTNGSALNPHANFFSATQTKMTTFGFDCHG